MKDHFKIKTVNCETVNEKLGGTGKSLYFCSQN